MGDVEWTQVVHKKEKKEKKDKNENKEKTGKSTLLKTCDVDLEGWEQAGRKKGKKPEEKTDLRQDMPAAGKSTGSGLAQTKEKIMAARSRPALHTQAQNGAQKLLC